MFPLRERHLDALRAGGVASFEADLTRHLFEHFPTACAGIGTAADVRAFVHRGVARAAGHGIDTAGAVAVFVELLAEYGEAFERSPDRTWVNNILAHPVLPGYVKVEAVRDRLAARTGGRVVVPFRPQA